MTIIYIWALCSILVVLYSIYEVNKSKQLTLEDLFIYLFLIILSPLGIIAIMIEFVFKILMTINLDNIKINKDKIIWEKENFKNSEEVKK